jgi:hypothetical protein
MTIESATYISDLNASFPAAGDLKSEGDDHLRLLKSTVKATFPNVAGAVSATHTQLSFVTGVTSAIQTQLDAKAAASSVAGFAPLAGATFTGTVTAPSFSGPLTGNASTATTAANASAVPWTGVSGRPTNVSAFTNDSGYITAAGAAAAGSLTGSTLASNVLNSSLTTVGNLSALTVTAPIVGSVTGSSGSCTGNAATATSASSVSNATSNGFGTRTVQAGGSPSGGADGDITYIY